VLACDLKIPYVLDNLMDRYMYMLLKIAHKNNIQRLCPKSENLCVTFSKQNYEQMKRITYMFVLSVLVHSMVIINKKVLYYFRKQLLTLPGCVN